VRERGRKTGAVTLFDIYLLTDEKGVLLFHLNAFSVDEEFEFDTLSKFEIWRKNLP
jgi:hypothetical protein